MLNNSCTIKEVLQGFFSEDYIYIYRTITAERTFEMHAGSSHGPSSGGKQWKTEHEVLYRKAGLNVVLNHANGVPHRRTFLGTL